jgi:hypothetical protein
VYKKTKGYIEAAVINEKATINTTSELSPASGILKNNLTRLTSSVDAIGTGTIHAFNSYAENKARDLGIPGIAFKPTAIETKAKTIIPGTTDAATAKGYRGYAEALGKLDSSVRTKYPYNNRMVDTQELGRLCNGTNSALDIKKLLDSQIRSGETDLQDIVNYIYILKEAGLVNL